MRSDSYKCPICKTSNLQIQEERVGDPGFRDTEYEIVSRDCNCITYECDTVIYTIKNSEKMSEENEETCDFCFENQAVSEYPSGKIDEQDRAICGECFSKEMIRLKEQSDVFWSKYNRNT